MDIAKMQTTLTELANSSSDISLPGLDFNTVVENIVVKKYSKDLDKLSKEDEKKEKEKLINYYKTTAFNEINSNIIKVKSCTNSLKIQVDNIQTSITNTISTLALPSVVSVPPAAPNPAYAVFDNKQKVAIITSLIASAALIIIDLLDASIKIQYELPDSVFVLIETFKTLKQSLSSIPI